MDIVKISLNTFDKVKRFVNITYRLDCKLNLVSERYMVDGKSIMGIFGLDLTKPIEMHIVNSKCDMNYITSELGAFII